MAAAVAVAAAVAFSALAQLIFSFHSGVPGSNPNLGVFLACQQHLLLAPWTPPSSLNLSFTRT